MATRQQIDELYQAALQAAELFRDSDPAEYSRRRVDAADARAASLGDLVTSQDGEIRRVSLVSAKARFITEFPLADPEAVTGDSEEALRSAAERSHTYIKGVQERAAANARAGSRAERSRAYAGGDGGGGPALPSGGDSGNRSRSTTDVYDAAYDRTAKLIHESGQGGDVRDVTGMDRRDPEMQAIRDYHTLHPQSGLSVSAMLAKQQGGRAEGSDQRSDAALAAEDSRG